MRVAEFVSVFSFAAVLELWLHGAATQCHPLCASNKAIYCKQHEIHLLKCFTWEQWWNEILQTCWKLFLISYCSFSLHRSFGANFLQSSLQAKSWEVFSHTGGVEPIFFFHEYFPFLFLAVYHQCNNSTVCHFSCFRIGGLICIYFFLGFFPHIFILFRINCWIEDKI